MTRISFAVAATFVALAACAQEIPFVPGQAPAGKLSDAEREAATLAIATLAADLEIPQDRIAVDTVRAVEWRDSSLGCPRPGAAYLDVISPGFKVTLRVGKEIHVVHEAGSRAFVCRQSKAALGGITPDRQLEFGPALLVARRDLAGRIGVTERDIAFVSAEGKTWNDGSLGCPEPGRMYTQAQIPGWVLTFKARERLFTYHTDLSRTVPCPPITAD